MIMTSRRLQCRPLCLDGGFKQCCWAQVWLGVILAPPFALTRWWLGGLLNDVPNRALPTHQLQSGVSACQSCSHRCSRGGRVCRQYAIHGKFL